VHQGFDFARTRHIVPPSSFDARIEPSRAIAMSVERLQTSGVMVAQRAVPFAGADRIDVAADLEPPSSALAWPRQA
jgi:hypothetical protein